MDNIKLRKAKADLHYYITQRIEEDIKLTEIERKHLYNYIIELCKKEIKEFQKTLDKIQKICYNSYRK